MNWADEARKKLKEYSDKDLQECLKDTLYHRRDKIIEIIIEHNPEHLLREIAEGP